MNEWEFVASLKLLVFEQLPYESQSIYMLNDYLLICQVYACVYIYIYIYIDHRHET